jgi:magnesium transporter
MLRTFQIQNSRLCETPQDQANIFVYMQPDDKEKAHLTGFWQIDEHTLNSALDPDELGRIEFDGDLLTAIIKKPKRYAISDNFVFKISSIGLFVHADKLVVVIGDEDINWESPYFW